MFGFSWAEIGIILAVALIAIRTVTGLMKKARGMAGEFQGHLDEMMREANLSDVKTEINKIRRFDFKSAATSVVDPDGSLADLAAKPFEMPTSSLYTPPAPVVEETPDAPAFIPPDAARKKPVPAFIPPGTKRWGY